MTKLNRLMLGGDPAAGLLPTPDSAQTQRIQEILTSDETPRFEGTPSRRRRRQWWLLVLAALVTAGVVTASVVSGQRNSIPVLSPEPVPTLTASELLLKAADAQTDLEVLPGQWWEQRTVGTYPGSAEDPSRPEFDGWLWVFKQDIRQFELAGTPTRSCFWHIIEEPIESLNGYPGDMPQDLIPYLSVGCGQLEDRWFDPGYESIPRDPTGLQEYIEQAAQENSTSATPFDEALKLLVGSITQPPAELRSAVYRYLASDPDVTITDESVQLDDRTGVAIGLPSSTAEFPQHLILDPQSGEFLGLGFSFGNGPVDYGLRYTWQSHDALPPEFLDQICPKDPNRDLCQGR